MDFFFLGVRYDGRRNLQRAAMYGRHLNLTHIHKIFKRDPRVSPARSSLAGALDLWNGFASSPLPASTPCLWL